ncbi:MAG: AbrB/MazE/SpoVT family DNA-binding domain-containing protein [Rickettsia endosymbiont of Oxypoda opaca]|nr:AbrB/MazE/SpoVT family DNA-binding domain-containing protein [Rickettsia endosymbiont of Oxypoda opaca]
MKNYYSTLTSKGQLTIPTFIREKLNLSSGIKVEFIIQDNHIILIPINNPVRKLQGILPKPQNIINCEEMDEIIRGKHDRY